MDKRELEILIASTTHYVETVEDQQHKETFSELLELYKEDYKKMTGEDYKK